MKHLYTLLILLLFVPFALVAQSSNSKDITYTVGAPYPVIDAKNKDYFEHNGTIITVKIQKDEVFIQKLEANTLKFKSVKIYDDFPKGFVRESVVKVQDHLYFFYSVWDRSNETEQLFYREIDFEKGIFVDRGTRLIKVNGKVISMHFQPNYLNMFTGFGSVSTLTMVDKFTVSTSADESKVLIQYRKKPEKRNDNVSHDVIGFHVFNPDLEKDWAKDVRMPYTEKKMNNHDYAVDAFGNAFMMATVYLDDSTKPYKKDGSCNYRMELIKIDASTQELTKTKIALKDNFINGAWLYEASEGEIICTGYYNDDGKDGSNAKGVFTAKFSPDGTLEPLATYEIPLEVLNQYVSKRIQKKNERKDKKDKGEFQDLSVKKLITSLDGSITIIGQQEYIIVSSSSNSSMKTYRYYYNDILVTKINPDGSLAYMKKLPKRQLGTTGQGGLSFQHFLKDNDHYFLFLDHVENLDAPVDKRLPGMHRDGAGGYLTAYKMNGTSGEVSKFSILNVRDVPEVKSKELYQFSVNRILNLSDNEFVIEFYKKKKEDVLVKFTMN